MNLKQKLEEGYRKAFDNTTAKGYVIRRLERSTPEQLEELAAKYGVENTKLETLYQAHLKERVNEGVEFLFNVDNEKLFEMAQWNHNTLSYLVVEERFRVKMEKTEKRRRPQLNKLAEENNIKF